MSELQAAFRSPLGAFYRSDLGVRSGGTALKFNAMLAFRPGIDVRNGRQQNGTFELVLRMAKVRTQQHGRYLTLWREMKIRDFIDETLDYESGNNEFSGFNGWLTILVTNNENDRSVPVRSSVSQTKRQGNFGNKLWVKIRKIEDDDGVWYGIPRSRYYIDRRDWPDTTPFDWTTFKDPAGDYATNPDYDDEANDAKPTHIDYTVDVQLVDTKKKKVMDEIDHEGKKTGRKLDGDWEVSYWPRKRRWFIYTEDLHANAGNEQKIVLQFSRAAAWGITGDPYISNGGLSPLILSQPYTNTSLDILLGTMFGRGDFVLAITPAIDQSVFGLDQYRVMWEVDTGDVLPRGPTGPLDYNLSPLVLMGGGGSYFEPIPAGGFWYAPFTGPENRNFEYEDGLPGRSYHVKLGVFFSVLQTDTGVLFGDTVTKISKTKYFDSINPDPDDDYSESLFFVETQPDFIIPFERFEVYELSKPETKADTVNIPILFINSDVDPNPIFRTGTVTVGKKYSTPYQRLRVGWFRHTDQALKASDREKDYRGYAQGLFESYRTQNLQFLNTTTRTNAEIFGLTIDAHFVDQGFDTTVYETLPGIYADPNIDQPGSIFGEYAIQALGARYDFDLKRCRTLTEEFVYINTYEANPSIPKGGYVQWAVKADIHNNYGFKKIDNNNPDYPLTDWDPAKIQRVELLKEGSTITLDDGFTNVALDYLEDDVDDTAEAGDVSQIVLTEFENGIRLYPELQQVCPTKFFETIIQDHQISCEYNRFGEFRSLGPAGTTRSFLLFPYVPAVTHQVPTVGEDDEVKEVVATENQETNLVVSVTAMEHVTNLNEDPAGMDCEISWQVTSDGKIWKNVEGISAYKVEDEIHNQGIRSTLSVSVRKEMDGLMFRCAFRGCVGSGHAVPYRLKIR